MCRGSLALGRRDCRSHCTRRQRRLWFAGRSPATAQCQGYSRAVPPESLEGASANSPAHRLCRAALAKAVVLMPSIPIIMPQLGESIAEATVVNLLVKVGDQVRTDQDLMEVETSKATMNVASPCPGRVEKLSIKLNESYPVGAVLGYLEASAEDATRLGLDAPAPEKNGQDFAYEAGADPRNQG